jgi:hypothetical protein
LLIGKLLIYLAMIAEPIDDPSKALPLPSPWKTPILALKLKGRCR